MVLSKLKALPIKAFASSFWSEKAFNPALFSKAICCKSSNVLGFCCATPEKPSKNITITIGKVFCLDFRSFIFFLSESKIEYKTGKTTKVRIVAVTKPPITTVASGRCTSAPALVEIAIGKKPSAAAEAVNKTARKRSFAPNTISSFLSFIPSFLSSLKCSINTIPLSTAIPKSAINPTPAEILKGISRTQSNNTPPTAAKGIAE